jgi:hypothetical protein
MLGALPLAAPGAGRVTQKVCLHALQRESLEAFGTSLSKKLPLAAAWPAPYDAPRIPHG